MHFTASESSTIVDCVSHEIDLIVKVCFVWLKNQQQQNSCVLRNENVCLCLRMHIVDEISCSFCGRDESRWKESGKIELQPYQVI